MVQRLRRALSRSHALIPPVILALFLLPALTHLIRTTALPCTHDNVFHLFRIVAMRSMLRHGWLFSRWIPNLALGYGYPFFNYREPLPYLVGEGLFAAGLPIALVLGLIYAASLVGAAWGAYRLAADLFGERAAWVAGVAYGLGPYLLLDPLRRGNMPESVALALLPWLFVVARRVILGRGRGAFVTMTVILVALFLSHNISGLLLAPFLGAYVVLLAWRHRDRRAWPYAFAAAAIAALVTAWFWLPALAERDWVQLHLSRTTRNNDFHYNFVSWAEMLFTFPSPYDPLFLNPPMRVYVGVGQGLLALVGAVVGLCRRGRPDRRVEKGRRCEERLLVGLFVVAALVYLWMSTPAAVGLWEAVPLLSFVQFPWRLVGRALLPVSLLAGVAFEALPSGDDDPAPRWLRIVARAALPTVLVVLAVLAWPDTVPPKGICPTERYPDMSDLYRVEADLWMGMDPESSYFPIWVEEHPDSMALAEDFIRGELPARFDVASLPEGGEVVDADYRPLSAEVVVRSPVGFRARWLGLYFPGWRVEIDGQEILASPEDDTGLLTFSVPAGEHTVRVAFASATPARRTGIFLSVIGLVALGLALFWSRRTVPDDVRTQRTGAGGTPRRSGDTFDPQSENTALGRESLVSAPSKQVWLVGGVALAVMVVRLLVITRLPASLGPPDRRVYRRLGIDRRLDQDFDGGLTLLGAAQHGRQMTGDGELGVGLLWTAREQPAEDYATSVLLRGVDGEIWSPAGTVRPRGYEPPPPTSGWAPFEYAYDPHIVTPLTGTPPGTYEVVVALFDRHTLAPASALGDDGTVQGTDLVLGTVEVEHPVSPYDLRSLGVVEGATVRACGAVGLWSMTVDRVAGAPGDVVAVRWVWEALSVPEERLTARLVLRDGTGEQVKAWSLPPVAAWWPTDQWMVGDRWLGQHVVRLPGSLKSGRYTLETQLSSCGDALEVVEFEVVAPERVWAVSPELAPLDVVYGVPAGLADSGKFEPAVRLAGYALARSSQALGLELAWQSLAEMDMSYHVFVHLVDAGGSVVAQSDGVPVAWTRPTTGWAAGEVVTEVREIALPVGTPPGPYRLRVGWYLPDRYRLVTESGDDAPEIDTVRIPTDDGAEGP
ncbi:MAG: 6-pyruvoyl-tetrahydropterin synthase-related protein [Anaerolineae bacterium]